MILNFFPFRHTLFIINCHYTITLNIFHAILIWCVVITQVSKCLVANFNPFFSYRNLYGYGEIWGIYYNDALANNIRKHWILNILPHQMPLNIYTVYLYDQSSILSLGLLFLLLGLYCSLNSKNVKRCWMWKSVLLGAPGSPQYCEAVCNGWKWRRHFILCTQNSIINAK